MKCGEGDMNGDDAKDSISVNWGWFIVLFLVLKSISGLKEVKVVNLGKAFRKLHGVPKGIGARELFSSEIE